MEHYTKNVVDKTRSEKERQAEGVRQAFNLAFDNYAVKFNGDLPDLTEDSINLFIQSRPELQRALAGCQLINRSEMANIALEIMRERIKQKQDTTEIK